MRYNGRHRVTGHLFGGRYKAVLVDAGEGEYFRTLVDYMHLNPVRAGLVPVTLDELPEVSGYKWSSLPHFASKPSLRPGFLEIGRTLKAFGFKDGPAGRRQFVERVALRAQREEVERCGLAEIDGQGLQSTLRRGWCYGSPTFKERMLELAEDLLSRRSSRRKASKNYRGEEVNDHGERRANEVVRAGLEAFGLEDEDLESMKKSADEKALIASLIREGTTVRLEWITKKLKMGSVANVTRACVAIAERLPKERALRRSRNRISANISS